ncbi:MAG TPA: ABC transporter permease [Solirubrobacteraceae bacterium]|jgi:ABC-2 type transport system permease protein|nr:ABC transporter permease [Solirubrobacteraceae bacterium]
MYWLIKYLLRVWRQRQTRLAVAGGDVPLLDQAPASTAPGRAVSRAREQGPSAASRGPLMLLAHQVRYDIKTSLRNPRARFFTFFFPVVLLVVFNGVFGNGHTRVDGVRVKMSEFYVPGILTMSIVVASYASMVISIATLRESGVLKRRRATPAPAALLIGGQALATVLVTFTMSTLLLAISKVFYGIGLAPGAIAAVACVVLVGTITFTCIAYAVAGLIGSPDAAQPVVQATMLPLWFISSVFIPETNLSHSLRTVGKVFPVEHLANPLHLASIHGSFGGAISGTDLLVLAAWAVAAAAFAAWRFSWLPSTASA